MVNRHRLQRLDLNLLLAFDVLIEECNVTRAAERLNVGQPAMSASLAKLRKILDDPLLVREGRQLLPTPVALELVSSVREALDLIAGAVDSRESFDPTVDRRTFTIMASDYVLVLFLADLLDRLARAAPHVKFSITPLADDPIEELRREHIDLQIFPRELTTPGPEALSESLFADRFVCVVDRDHPEVLDRLTKQQFATLPYIAYHNQPMQSAPERRMATLGIERPIEVAAQSFVSLPLMLRGTRFFTLVHLRLAERIADDARVRWIESPYSFDPIHETMFWSRRLHADPAHQWLRSQLATEARKMRPL